MIFTSEPYIDREIIDFVTDTLLNDFWVGGEVVNKLEEEFARYIGTDYAIAVSSGTDALKLVQQCLNVKGEVVTTSSTFKATVGSIVGTGNVPVFADIDMHTCNIDPKEVVKVLGLKTELILPVHLYGMPCDMDELYRIADKRGLHLVEDVCQAIGASCNGKKVGNLGTAGCFSFYTTKIVAGGQGGMITTNDKDIYERARLLREHTATNGYYGYNARMPSICAAIVLKQLEIVKRLVERRNQIASIYDKQFSDLPIALPYNSKGRVYYLYVVRSPNRDALKSFLAKKNIMCGVHYPVPVHLEHEYYPFMRGPLPNSVALSNFCLSLPCHNNMSNKDVTDVCDGVKEFFENGGI